MNDQGGAGDNSGGWNNDGRLTKRPRTGMEDDEQNLKNARGLFDLAYYYQVSTSTIGFLSYHFFFFFFFFLMIGYACMQFLLRYRA